MIGREGRSWWLGGILIRMKCHRSFPFFSTVLEYSLKVTIATFYTCAKRESCDVLVTINAIPDVLHDPAP
jgi:hypothetical protein